MSLIHVGCGGNVTSESAAGWASYACDKCGAHNLHDGQFVKPEPAKRLAIIDVPKNMVDSIGGLAAPSLNRWKRKDWEEYLEQVYLNGYQQGMRDMAPSPLSARACTCLPLLDQGVEAAVEISKNCPVHGGQLL